MKFTDLTFCQDCLCVKLLFNPNESTKPSQCFPFHSSSRISGEKPRQPPYRHHPARPLVQEQVHQADLPGRCCYGNARFLSVVVQGDDGWCSASPHTSSHSSVSSVFLLFKHQFLCGYQQPSTSAPKVTSTNFGVCVCLTSSKVQQRD